MSAEKRVYTRYGYQHHLLLVMEGFGPVNGQMANICAGGLWIDSLESPPLRRKIQKALARGHRPLAEVHVFSQSGDQTAVFHATGQFLRAEAGGFGFRFLTDQGDLVRRLTARSAELGGDIRLATIPDTVRADLLRQVERRVLPELDRLIDDLWERVPVKGALFKNLKGQHQQLVRGAWSEFESPGDQAGLAALELVEIRSFDRWLELQQIAGRLNRLLKAPLFRLNQYLSLVARRPIDDAANPVSPITQARLIHELSASNDGFPEELLEALLPLAERVLGDHLQPLLKDLDSLFVSAGIHALSPEQADQDWENIRDHPRELVVSARSACGDDESSQEGGPSAPSEATPSEAPASGAVPSPGNLLHFMSAAEEVSGRPEDSAASISVDSLLQAIYPHWAGVRDALQERQESLAQVLSDFLQDTLDGALSTSTRERLEIVDRLLELPERAERNVSQLFRELRLPVAEVVLRDERFLVVRDHPLRQCLNQLYELAWHDGASRHQNHMLEDAREAFSVQPLEEPRLESLNRKLDEGLQRLERQSQHQAERMARKYEGQDRLNQARQDVAQRLDALFHDRKVPVILEALLDVGLEHKLVLSCLREGRNSDALARSIERIRRLVDYLTGLAIETLPEPLMEEQFARDVLAKVSDELEDAYQPLEARGVYESLEAQLEDPALIEFIPYQPRYHPANTLELIPGENISSRWVARANALQAGDWLHQQQVDGDSLRFRLVWYPDDRRYFVCMQEGSVHETVFSLNDVLEGFEASTLWVQPTAEPDWVDQCLFHLVDDLYAQMAFQAIHDPLTGALNRHELQKQLDAALVMDRAKRLTSVLLWFNIDQFALVNSTHGTEVGDRMLCEICQLVDNWIPALPGRQVLGRMGGDEFALLTTPCGIQDGLSQAQRLLGQFEGHRFGPDDSGIRATVSVGLLLLDDDIGNASDACIRASQACDLAREKGGNQIQIYREDERESGRQQALELVRRIDQTLAGGLLSLRAQKIQAVSADGRPPKYEVLLQMPTSEDGSVLSPQAFMDAAERFRRSVQVDRWVVSSVLDWLRRHPEKGDEFDQLTVNLSAHSLSDDGFMHFIDRELSLGGFEASRLCLELTETAAVGCLMLAADFISSLKRYGCRFALDDFGTGFSSYAYLQQLPVDYLKIDGLFIRDVEHNEKNYAMVRSIAELGHYLGIEVIAECVETEAAMEVLEELGIQWAQGWYIARPIPLASL